MVTLFSWSFYGLIYSNLDIVSPVADQMVNIPETIGDTTDIKINHTGQINGIPWPGSGAMVPELS